MKKSGTVKIVVIVLILAIVVLACYYYLNSRVKKEAAEETTVPTVVQNVLMKDLERSYPPTPKEVLKYYCEITECFYNEEYTEEELEALALKIQELYDDELVANKSQEDYMKDLHSDIASMKDSKYTIYSYEISASTDVEYFTQDGYSCARMYCTFNLKQEGATGVIASAERFVLRQDEDGHWKILGWELAD
ncbi:MAG: hypothetical protein J6A08_02650 [Lachnospiraceae bacterium]|nr:hypothetical protein [Lachnospiraceae bacterium]